MLLMFAVLNLLLAVLNYMLGQMAVAGVCTLIALVLVIVFAQNYS